MNSDEWLGIVAWVNQRVKRPWTLDQAARLGLALKRTDADKVRAALSRLIDRGTPLDATTIYKELRRPPSRFGDLIASRHRELYPNRCPFPDCDVCLDINTKAV